MSDDANASTDPAVARLLAGLQDQIDALTVVLESHQRMFERLRARGVLADDQSHDDAATT